MSFIAIAYEIQLAELMLKNAPQNERITRVFQILEELIPNLGVYSKVMKIVKEELIGKSDFIRFILYCKGLLIEDLLFRLL